MYVTPPDTNTTASYCDGRSVIYIKDSHLHQTHQTHTHNRPSALYAQMTHTVDDAQMTHTLDDMHR